MEYYEYRIPRASKKDQIWYWVKVIGIYGTLAALIVAKLWGYL